MLEIDIDDVEQHLDQDDLDEEDDEFGRNPQRPQTRKYQQQVTANFHLPYRDLLETESSEWLEEIKEGLAKSVLTGDYRPGLVIWIGRLEQYLRLFGRKFSKDEHILLIKFFFELITDENMEPAIVSRSAQLFCDLVRKTDLLTPDDIEFPWRKLYDTYERFQYNRDEWHGLMSVPESMERRLSETIFLCRVYFTNEATQEMLDTWRPMLCPHSPSMKKAVKYLSMFLPTLPTPKRGGEHMWHLWFEEMMGIWMTFSGVPGWDGDMVALFARLATEAIGLVDWTPYISTIFTKYIRNLRLPVGKKRLKLVFGHRGFDPANCASWPVGMLHHEACILALEDLFKAVESYFYPSNHGEWSDRLSGLLMRIPMFLVIRVNDERYREKTWVFNGTPEAHLTDEQIRRVVRAMKPVVLLSMYSKGIGSRLESMFAMKHLAELCPEEIVPDLLERLYPALDTVTEPHRLTSTMASMAVCMRSLFSIKDGKRHIIPLLSAVLPGIDSNDFKKSACTFQFITCLLSMVPLEDCSRYADREDLTDEERDLCLETSGFEEFALQCIDRCLVYISNSTNDLHGRHDSVSRDINERMTHEEKFTRLGMASVVATIVYQSSDKICEAVLQKIFSFVSNRTLSYNHYTGGAVANFCATAMKLRPEVAGREILEPILKLVKVRVGLRANDIATDEHIDDELAWTVRVMCDTLSCCGRAILGHRSTLVQCLHTLLSAKSLPLYKQVSAVLRAVLKGVLTTFPVNIKSFIPSELDISPEEYVPVRNWCQLVQQKKVKIEWHVPDEDEIDFAEDILKEFLLPALAKLKSHANDDGTVLDRKELERTLLVVEMCIGGAGIRFPFDVTPENRLLPCSTSVEIYSKHPDPTITANSREIQLNGQPARQYIFDHIQPVLRKISAADEDDVKSIKIILRIFRSLMFYRGLEGEEVQNRLKGHIVSRKQQSRSLGSPKMQTRLLVLERAVLQHERRHYDHRGSPLTLLRSNIMKELLKLATGDYRDIRILGQNYFHDALSNLQFTYRAFVDDIVDALEASKDSKELAAKMKGSLYLILGGKSGSLILKHDWLALSKCFPVLIKVSSESKTVASILDKLADKMDRNFSTTMIHISQAEGAMAVAREIIGASTVNGLPDGHVSGSAPDLEDIWEKRAIESRNNESLYFILVNELLDFVRERLTKPKNFHFALFVLSYLIRRDVALLPNMIDTFMDNWANPSSEKARKICQHPMLSIMRWLKRPVVRVQLDLKKMAAIGTGNSVAVSQMNGEIGGVSLPLAGIRPDNLWLCLDENRLPRNSEEYENTIFVEKIQHGYYGWPEKLKVSAPVKDQVVLGKVPDCLSQLEKIVYEKMSDDAYVDILIRLLSMEDSKLHGKFDTVTFWIFRTMFRHFEDAFLPLFLGHLDKLIMSKDEHQHRCAAEILAGIVRGSKRWPYKKITRLWEQLTPLIKNALSHLTTESLADWGEFAHSGLNEGDSRRTFPLLKLLFDLPKTDTSFQASSRLFVLQSAFFLQYDWRRKNLHEKIAELMKERIEERYRDRVAWTLANMYRCEVNLPNANKAMEQGPRMTTFIEEYLPKCRVLLRPLAVGEEQPEDAMKVLKTVVKLVSQHVLNTMGYAPAELQKFLPFLMRFESDTRDEELRRDCIAALACLSQIALSPPETEEMLHQVELIMADTKSGAPWRDRVLALEHLQTAVFSNFFSIKSRKDWIQRVQRLTLESLEADSLEVREMASVTLAGLVQCSFLALDKRLLDEFYKKSETKYRTGEATKPTKALLARHAGVLGLCAYIIASPYSIGEHEPDVLVILSGHINDPQPINQTVKNTIKEFRRTHLDNWSEHKQKFTEDQLAVLTDLLVSPTYYA